MEIKYYPSKMAFAKALLDKSVECQKDIKINYAKTLKVPLFSFVTDDDAIHLCNDRNTFAKKFNDIFGDIIVAEKTRTAGSRNTFIVGFNTESIINVDDPTVDNTPPTKELDMEYINSLKEKFETKAAQKEALESYAKETFGVDLNRSKSFDNMLLDLQAALV